MLVAYFDFLTNVPLNNTYKNAVQFTSESERSAFFQHYRVFTTGETTSYNFNYKPNPNSLLTSIVFSFEGLPMNKKTWFNVNYLIVHQNIDNETEPTEGYYFVTGVKCIRDNVVEYQLELDVMSTYPFNIDFRMKNKVMVERRHCNRFITSRPPIVKRVFNDYYANGGDELDGQFKAQYPTVPVHFEQNKNPYDEDEQISENLTRSEVYEYIEKYEWEMLITTEPINRSLTQFTFPSSFNSSDGKLNHYTYFPSPSITYYTTKMFNSKSSLDSGVYVYIYPKYGDDVNKLLLSDVYDNLETLKLPLMVENVTTTTGEKMLSTFIKEPQLEAITTAVSRMIIPHNFVYGLIGRYAKKGNIVVPTTTTGSNQRTIENYIYFEFFPLVKDSNKINVLPSSQENDNNVYNTTLFENNHRYQVQLLLTDIDYKNIKCWQFLNTDFRFYPDIEQPNVNDFKSMYLEPKLFKPPYTKYIMKSLLSTNEGFEINPLALRDNRTNIIAKFVPTPSLIRFSYFVEKGGLNSPYNNLQYINVGSISTMDYSLPIKTDKYWEMITNKRNYAISGLATPVISSLGVAGGMVGATMAFNPAGLMSSVAGASIGAMSAVTSAVNYITNVDDLINAPDSVKNTGNEPLSDFGLNIPLTPYIVVYEMTEQQKQQVFDYYYRYGYLVNTYFNFDECFGRQRFNYIKTKDDEIFEKIEGVRQPLSNEVRMKMQEVLNNGITFWNVNYAIDMSLEYENAEI